MNGSNFKLQSGRIHLTILLGYTLLTLVMTWPLARNWTTAIPGDSFDGWQNYWNLWWLKVALVERQQNPFFTDLLYYPTGVGLYFHTLNPFNGLVTLPVQLSWGLIPAYNAVVLISWVLGGYGAYLLALWVLQHPSDRRRYNVTLPHSVLGTPHLPAFLAGLIFTFSPFHMAHLLGHMQVMALQWIPFYVLYLLRAVNEQRGNGRQGWLRNALLAGLFLTLAGLCDWYFVLYLFLFTGIVVVWNLGAWLFERERRRGLAQFPLTVFAAPIVAGLVFLGSLAPILLPMVREATQFSFMIRPAADLYSFSASLMDFFTPNRLHTLLRPDSYTWMGNQVAPPSERTISIGYIPLILLLVAAWRDRKRAGFWLISALFFLLLALGPRLHWGDITQVDIPTGTMVIERWTPYALLNRLVPFMRISRSVSRFALMVQLSVAIAAAIGLGALLGRSEIKKKGFTLSPPHHPTLSVGVTFSALLVLAEFWVAPYPISPPDTPSFYTQLRDLPTTGAVLNLPMNYDRPGYLLYQTVHQKSLTVGYISRDDPRTLTERVPVLQHFRHLGPDILAIDPAMVGLTVLHDIGVATVILDRYKMPGGLEREYTDALAAAIFADQSPLYADERLTVYQVPPSTQPVPYLTLAERNWGPLQQADEHTRWRSIGVEPAVVQLHHNPAGTALRIQYHTQAGSSLHVRSGNGDQILATLAPASTSSSTLVDIGQLQTIQLMADTPEGVAIEAIDLVLPR
jgi:hypothetical protein